MKEMTLKEIYDKLIMWVLSQGTAIVVLICVCVYFYTNQKVLENKVEKLETSVQTLNDKLIECEKSKIYIPRYPGSTSSE